MKRLSIVSSILLLLATMALPGCIVWPHWHDDYGYGHGHGHHGGGHHGGRR